MGKNSSISIIISKKLIVLLLAPIVLIAAAQYFHARPKFAARNDLSRFFPDSPVVYIEVNNAGSHWQNFVSSHFLKRLGILRLPEILRTGGASLRHEQTAKEVMSFLNSGKYRVLARHLFADHFAVALYPFHFSGFDDKSIRNISTSFILVSRIGDQELFKELMMDSLRQIRAKWILRELSIEDQPFFLLVSEDQTIRISYAMIDDYVIMGLGERPVRRCLNTLSGNRASLKDDTLFQDAKSMAMNKQAFFLFLDNKHFLEKQNRSSPSVEEHSEPSAAGSAFTDILTRARTLIELNRVRTFSLSAKMIKSKEVASLSHIRYVDQTPESFCLSSAPKKMPFNFKNSLLYHWSGCNPSPFTPGAIRLLFGTHQSASSDPADERKSLLTKDLISSLGEEAGFVWQGFKSKDEKQTLEFMVFSRPRFPIQTENILKTLEQELSSLIAYRSANGTVIFGPDRSFIEKAAEDSANKQLEKEARALSKEFDSVFFLNCEQAMQELSKAFQFYQKQWLRQRDAWSEQQKDELHQIDVIKEAAETTMTKIGDSLQQLTQIAGAGEDDPKALTAVKKLLGDIELKKNLLQKISVAIEEMEKVQEPLLAAENSDTEELTKEGKKQLEETRKMLETRRKQQKDLIESLQKMETSVVDTKSQPAFKKQGIESGIDELWEQLKNQEEEQIRLNESIERIQAETAMSLKKEDFLKMVFPPIIETFAEIRKIISATRIEEKTSATHAKILLK
ncbi:MAG: hypothetical protein AB1650_01490 [Candidatus Omnitrophota bacterium]